MYLVLNRLVTISFKVPYVTDLIGFSKKRTDCHYDRYGRHRRIRHHLLRLIRFRPILSAIVAGQIISDIQL